MKKLNKYFWLVAILSVMTTACEEDDKAEIGEPYSKVDGINGSWIVSTVNQIDEQSVLRDAKDLSEYFVVPGEQSLEIEFNGEDFSYAVIPGPGSNPFGDGGDWTFDDLDYPSEVWLMPMDEADTIVVTLGQPVYEHSSELLLNQNKYCIDGATGDETLILAYEYKFLRQ